MITGAVLAAWAGSNLDGSGIAELDQVGDHVFDVGTLCEAAAAKALDGADISVFIGLPAAGILYYLFCRPVDVAGETRVAEAEAAALEEAL